MGDAATDIWQKGMVGGVWAWPFWDLAGQLVLIILLAATLFYALRLERALGVLKRDRAALSALVAGFNDATRQAEAGIDRLRSAADGAGRQIARQTERASAMKDDLVFLTDRGDRLANRLDGLVRTARGLPGIAEPAWQPTAPVLPTERPRAARKLPAAELAELVAPSATATVPPPVPAQPPRLRSQAERDLLKALRIGR